MMRVASIRFVGVLALGALAAGCGNPSVPSPAAYTGEWMGTTAQGRPIMFTVSPSETVTSITLGHDFNGCSGLQTFPNLSISITPQVICVPGPCVPSVSSYRAFHFSSGDPRTGPVTAINALFVSAAGAQGTVNLDYPGCGSVVGVPWSAARR